MSVTIRKFNYLNSTHSEADDLVTLVRLVENERLYPEIGMVEDWENIGEAIRNLLSAEVRGNLLLTIGSHMPASVERNEHSQKRANLWKEPLHEGN